MGRLLCHLDGVGGRGEFVQRLDGAVGQAGQHVEQVFADRYAESAAAPHDAKDGCYLGPASLLPRCSQFRLPIEIGRIEFPAQFVDSSMIECFMNSVSFSQRFSV